MTLRFVIIGLLLLLQCLMGNTTPVTWDTLDDPGWFPAGEVAVVGRSVSGGNGGGFLQIDFGVGDFGVPVSDIVANTNAFYTGDYSSLVVSFDYFRTNASEQSLYFRSGDDGSVWAHLITNTASSWGNFSVSFFDANGWEYVEGGNLGSTFEAARANVDLFGFSIRTSSDPGIHTFGVDNLEFNNYATQVPEPSTVILLIAVVLCLLVTFRMDRFIGRSDWMKRLKMK